MTDFTNLRNALGALTNAITSTYADLLGTANANKEELRTLYAKITENRADILEFGKMLDATADVLGDTSDKCLDIGEKITETLFNGTDYLPVANYEDFIDFCDCCGEEIVVGDEYTCNSGHWYTCAECSAKLAEEENETTDEE